MKRLIKSVSLYMLGAAIGLVLLEVFYQTVEISLPYHELSPTVGKKMLPSRRITYLEDGFYLGKTNEFGYLGAPYPPVKETGKIRIALIGDSFTEGFHVFEQHHFSQILERKLNSDLNTPRYEVLNFGIGNYNYNDMIILYKNFVERFDCDILIFIVEAVDFDFRSNFIPSPVLKQTGDSLGIDYSFTGGNTFKYYSEFSFLFENSCVVKAANNAYKLTKNDEILGILFGKFYTVRWRSEEGARGAVVGVDRSTIDDRIIKSFDWLKGKTTFFVFKREAPPGLKSLLPAYGIGCLDLGPILDEKLEKNGISYNYWDVTKVRGHWNHAGQKVVANALYDMVKDNEK